MLFFCGLDCGFPRPFMTTEVLFGVFSFDDRSGVLGTEFLGKGTYDWSSSTPKLMFCIYEC